MYSRGQSLPSYVVAPDYVARWKRERAMLDALQASPRSRRRPAVEVYCRCPKRHLLISVFALPGDEAALWLHGGGRVPRGYLEMPAPLPDDIEAGLPYWHTAPDTLEIRTLSSMVAGKRLANVFPRCGLPQSLDTDDGPAIATAVREWLRAPGGPRVARLAAPRVLDS